MPLDLRADEVFCAAVSGIPRVAEQIVAMPSDDWGTVLDAVKEIYARTARDLGYDDADEQQWVSTVMDRLRDAIEKELIRDPDLLRTFR
jgi:hypothetical protein